MRRHRPDPTGGVTSGSAAWRRAGEGNRTPTTSLGKAGALTPLTCANGPSSRSRPATVRRSPPGTPDPGPVRWPPRAGEKAPVAVHGHRDRAVPQALFDGQRVSALGHREGDRRVPELVEPEPAHAIYTRLSESPATEAWAIGPKASSGSQRGEVWPVRPASGQSGEAESVASGPRSSRARQSIPAGGRRRAGSRPPAAADVLADPGWQ
jgi:hypothetical protein